MPSANLAALMPKSNGWLSTMRAVGFKLTQLSSKKGGVALVTVYLQAVPLMRRQKMDVEMLSIACDRRQC